MSDELSLTPQNNWPATKHRLGQLCPDSDVLQAVMPWDVVDGCGHLAGGLKVLCRTHYITPRSTTLTSVEIPAGSRREANRDLERMVLGMVM